MGKVDIPYYVVRKGHGYWRTTRKMRAAGFSHVRCGKDGPEAWAIAQLWNERWQQHRRGVEFSPAPVKAEAVERYPKGSIGEGFALYRETKEWERKAPRTREDWFRGWARIKLFAHISPKAIDLQDMSAWRDSIEKKHGLREAHRAMKIWRALWQVLAALKYCRKDDDPSFGVRNSEAAGRSATWSEGETVRLVKGAWRAGYQGMAVAIAVLWDSQLSPVDVRQLTSGQLRPSKTRTVILTSRQKTDAPAGGLLGRRGTALVAAYRASLGYDLLDHAPLLRTKGLATTTQRGGRPRLGVPYTKNSMAEEFRTVRELVFGKHEKRLMLDFRRSGAVEAITGGAKAEDLAQGMGNTLGASNKLFRDYVPVNIPMLENVEEQRKIGREKIRRLGPNTIHDGNKKA